MSNETGELLPWQQSIADLIEFAERDHYSNETIGKECRSRLTDLNAALTRAQPQAGEAESAPIIRMLAESRRLTKRQRWYLAESIANEIGQTLTDDESETRPTTSETECDQTRGEQLWRHKVRGTTYRVLFEAAKASSTIAALDDMTMVVYQGVADGLVWTRPAIEFFDGRFEELATPPTGSSLVKEQK